MNPVKKPEVTKEIQVNPIDIESLSLADLKEECKSRGLTGYSSLNKSELIKLLNKENE